MRLSRIYSNRPEIFVPIRFNPGLNVVLAEIRLTANRNRDTHNLGKTTLGTLLDFCMLSGDTKVFLLKHIDRFQGFVFYLELRLQDDSFVTVRRSVDDANSISFKRHSRAGQDYSFLGDAAWDHLNQSRATSRRILDGLLDLYSMKPWTFRKGLGYFLRSQGDYRDVFKLQRFMGKHSDWKPFVAHLMGFNANLAQEHYQKQSDLERNDRTIATLRSELGDSEVDLSRVEGLLLLKSDEVGQKQDLLNSFEFSLEDAGATKLIVEQIDQEIATLNQERYSLSHSRRKILSSLEQGAILFDVSEAESMFRESGIVFAGQIRKGFADLVAFNRAITDEREIYLRRELSEIEARLDEVGVQLSEEDRRRSSLLSFIQETDVFQKFREAADQLVTLRADVLALDRQRSFLHRIQELRQESRRLSEDISRIESELDKDVEIRHSDTTNLYSTIRRHFNAIVKEVIDRNALVRVYLNSESHFEFEADILDDLGNDTSADRGFSYKKLLCVAFDLAVIRSYEGRGYPRFVYHDGVFESLDDRKKLNLLNVMRRYSHEGVQQIVTLIDSDMPPFADRSPVFSAEEIVLLLHDEDDSGRLFRMHAW